MIDPGTALAIVGLGIDAVKQLHSYYVVWKGRDRDVEEIRQQLTWLMNLFQAIETTLGDDDLNTALVQMICESVENCHEIITKLEAKLLKVKGEGEPDTLLKKMDDQRRRALYPFKKGTIGGLLDLIDMCKDQMKTLIPLLNLDSSGKIQRGLKELDVKVTSVSKIVEETQSLIVDGVKENDRKNIMDWLNPINQAEIHAAALRKHEPGTGVWFLEGEVFGNWKRGPGTSLWLVGDVGCGKTVLFSSIVNTIEDTDVLDPTERLAAYFYCLYRKGAQHDLAPILQSFIAQLCPSNHIPKVLQDLYNLHNSKFPPGIPSNKELKETFLAMIRELRTLGQSSTTSDRNIFILMDALDELPLGKSRDEIIGFLDELASYRIPHLHILATGRDESDIRLGLKSWDRPLLIDKRKVAEDMRLYVNMEIKNDLGLFDKPAATKDEIVRRLVDEGNGMFRWAALQMEQLKALRPMRPSTIQKALQSLPKDLDESYQRILEKINPLNSQEALSALRWISFATRPLFIEELIEVCAINLDEDPEFDVAERYEPRDILDLLPGLIIINPPLKLAERPIYKTHVVTFSHFSVQEYLLGTRIVSSPAKLYNLDIRFSNHFIARCCLAYLLCCNTFELRKEDYPLRHYAWDYWAWHTVSEFGKSNQELSTDAEALFSSIAHQKEGPATDALGKLTSRLAHVAKWRLSSRLGENFEHCLSIPFFLDEFDYIYWYDAVPRTNSSSLLYRPQPQSQRGTSICLIELFPSPKRFTELRCRRFQLDLASNPVYDAMSYFWGPQQTSYMRINGFLQEVQSSLVADLRNLRPSEGERSRILFIDALSFDWRNPEKTELHMSCTIQGYHMDERIRLTPQIFKKAQQVAIGLGDRDEADASAIDFVTKVTSMPLPEGRVSKAVRQWSNDDPEWAECIGASVLNLFRRKWWTRLWPVQELILPRRATLYYGDIPITFETFQKFFEMAGTVKAIIGDNQFSKLASEETYIGARRVSNIRTQYWQGRQATLPELLWATQYHKVRESIIKIYAVAGLLNVEEQDSLWFSLDRVSSTTEKFVAVADWILQKYQNLDIFSYASCRRWEVDKRPANAPSWVPNFGFEGRSIEPLIYGVFGPKDFNDIYNAAGRYAAKFSISDDNLSITVTGVRLDHISLVEKPFTGQESNVELFSLFKRVEGCRLGTKSTPSQSTLEIFWRTLHLDQKDVKRLQSCNVKLAGLAVQNDKDLTLLFQKDGLFDLQTCKGRRLLMSSEGYFCLGPVEAKAGDIITVFPGAKVPYLLREPEENFELVGECYVHGIMDGEALKAYRDGESKLQDFRII